jgi:membrane associated rhomboid family serine protease
MMRITPCVKYLLIANIIIALIVAIFPAVSDVLALHYIGGSSFRPYQFFTYMFVHAGLMHIFFNMFALVQLGSLIETYWGSKRFSFYYLVCGLGAAIVHMLVCYYQLSPFQQSAQALMDNTTVEQLKIFAMQNSDLISNFTAGNRSLMLFFEDMVVEWKENPQLTDQFVTILHQQIPQIEHLALDRQVVGASGAVFGILLAFGMMFPDMKMGIIFLPFQFPAKYFVAFYAVAELFFGVNDFKGDNVAHYAHLGGMLFGLILILIWRKHPNNKFFNS